MSVTIVVNGEQRNVDEGQSVAGLLQELNLGVERLAVELNKRIVRRLDWPDIQLKPGDIVEIVHFVGGGC